ncbi:MAG: Gx transporter family protein [bacterium]|nr:MAG: Gx transporter family protein [bacterium]
MLSLNNSNLYFTNSKLVRLSLLISLGLILFLFESSIPRPLPWLKPGLAHIATLIAIFMMGISEAMIVVVTRVLVGSLLLGSLFNPAFVLSLGGGITATLAMGLIHCYFSQTFSIFGISILGAVVHNLTQLILVELLIVRRIEIFYLAPLMILSSLFTGFIVALVSYLLLSKVQSLLESRSGGY